MVDQQPTTDTGPGGGGTQQQQQRASSSVQVRLDHLAKLVNEWFWYAPLLFLYAIYQRIVRALFSPEYAPRPANLKPYGRIAVIGCGITGVSSAAHFVGHGFDVVIFESEKDCGGIWDRVNSTSSLQLNSILYRFHPTVMWSKGYPHRDEIVAQIKGVWERYGLKDKTRFNTKVTKVSRHPSSTDPRKNGHARWTINDGREGIFDAVVVAVGTCGTPKRGSIPGVDSFHGDVLHSSELDNAQLEGKKVVIVGSGASGVEAAELAVEKKAKSAVVLARDDKWIIPRNTVVDTMLALQPFGREMPLSFIPEWLVRTFHYRDLKDVSPPAKGLFEGTPIVNDDFLMHIRQGLVTYKRGDTLAITRQGVKLNERTRDTKPGDEGHEVVETADVVVLATGFERPSIDMLPDDLFPTEGERNYGRPNLYLQNFCTEDWSVLLTNASYMDAIGTVGNWHIGLYARVLMVFLLDETCRPSPKDMKLWVDFLTWLKTKLLGSSEKASGLAFFTYTELCIWIVTFHFFNISRLPWLWFVLFGWGVKPESNVAVKKARSTAPESHAEGKKAESQGEGKKEKNGKKGPKGKNGRSGGGNDAKTSQDTGGN
ncbi:dimethylaniline monooxygenase (N-oxide forming) [Pseudohyphozyma bogoriensis]|nr:dimethylaniline monooxygenase (N-oxide forming) [Pseudohyphozyma bogoriensis]